MRFNSHSPPVAVCLPIYRQNLMRSAAPPFVWAFIFFLLAACGEDPSSDSVSLGKDATDTVDAAERVDTIVTDTTRAVDTTSLRNGVGSAAASDWASASMRVTRSVTAIPVVVDLRAAAHEGYDRFVVEFQGDEIPGYTIRYLDDRPIECGSGHPLMIRDDAVLELHLEPTRGYTEEGAATVDHSAQSFGFEALKEGDVSCDFEAVFTVVLGITQRLPFRVDELSNPARLVVDVRHSGV